MEVRLVAPVLLLLVSPAIQAQDPKIKPAGERGAASVAALKTQAIAQVRSSAATAQFAAIKLTLANMLAEFQTNHSVVGAAEDEGQAVVYKAGEEEILRQVARQLTDFIATYPTSPEAEAARAVLARIYVRLQRVEDAARVLADFDPAAADTNTVLQVALASPAISAIAAKIAPMLGDAVANTDSLDQKMDTVFVAMRLRMPTAALDLITKIKGDVSTLEQQAALLLAEARLVARLARTYQVPVTRSNVVRTFAVSPLAGDLLSQNTVPTNKWATVAATDDATWARSKPVSPDEAQASGDVGVDGAIRAAAVARLEFLRSDVYKAIAAEAVPGVKLMQAWSRYTSTAIPVNTAPTDGVLPSDATVIGLLHRVVVCYPGTQAARIAAARLRAETTTRGDVPVPIEGPTIDGAVESLRGLTKQGKVVLVDFWATGDTDSLIQRGELADLYQTFRARGFEILSVNLDQKADEWLVRAAIAHFHMDWTVIFDGDGVHSPIAQTWGIDVLPARVLIGRDGTIFEDRADRLTPAAIHAVLQDALRQPPVGDVSNLADEDIDDGNRGPDDGKARDDGVGRPSNPDALPTAFSRDTGERISRLPPVGLGPSITCRLEVMESQPVQYAVTVASHVSQDGYRFVTDRIRRSSDEAEVYVSLVAEGPVGPTDPIMIQPVSQRIDLGSAVGAAIKIYVRRIIDKAHYIVEPEYTLTCRIDIPEDSRLVYVGPDIQTTVYSTDGDAKRVATVKVEVPIDGYVFALDKVRAAGDVTQVLLRLHAPAAAVANVDGSVRVMKLDVPLGDVQGNIEFLVDFRRAGVAGDVQYSLADTVKVH